MSIAYAYIGHCKLATLDTGNTEAFKKGHLYLLIIIIDQLSLASLRGR